MPNSHGLRYHCTLPLGVTISSRQCILWLAGRLWYAIFKILQKLHVKFGIGKSEIIMVYFCISASASLKSSRPTIWYFILYIVFEWLVRFAYLRTRDDGSQNKFVLIGRSGRIVIIVLGVFTHSYGIVNKLFWSTSIFGAWGCQKDSFLCSAMYVMLYYHSIIKLNIPGVFGASWVSITNKLSAKHDYCSSTLEMPLLITYFIIQNLLAWQESHVNL